jgi:hypothetical protein
VSICFTFSCANRKHFRCILLDSFKILNFSTILVFFVLRMNLCTCTVERLMVRTWRQIHVSMVNIQRALIRF